MLHPVLHKALDVTIFSKTFLNAKSDFIAVFRGMPDEERRIKIDGWRKRQELNFYSKLLFIINININEFIKCYI